ncbi:MAG: PD40 domain-containing protein [Thermoplasmatales archaeon]|nr:PD40 domain-containing protein [Thermoplasmatales archaeon]
MKYKKGKAYPSEKIVMRDEKTEIAIWQMTNYPANHSNLYYTKTSFTPDGKNIIILSCRTGYANLFSVSLESGEILQLTAHKEDIAQLSPCIAPGGSFVYYSLGSSIRFLNLSTLEDDVLVNFHGYSPGVLSMSSDGSFIITRLKHGEASVRGEIKKLRRSLKTPLEYKTVIKNGFNLLQVILSRFKRDKKYPIVLIPTNGSSVEYIKEVDQSGITLLSPDDKHILYHKIERELWICGLDGKNDQHLYGHGKNLWVTHPNWLSNNEVIFVEWPKALKGVNIEGKVRKILRFNCWHPTVNFNRSLIACDTAHPDSGIYAINPITSKKSFLFHSNSGSPKEWKNSRPPRALPFLPFFIRDQFGSQWTHPHPSFSPDGKKIIFNSTKGGKYSQVYIAHL